MTGLLVLALIWMLVNGQSLVQTVSDKLPLLGIASVLVGFGSVLGNGCTSGYGVCGISRLSGRSIVATVNSMSTAFIAILLQSTSLYGGFAALGA